jgi:hypothetical protein
MENTMAAETLIVGEKEYPIADLSDQNKYLAAQIEAMARKENMLKMELDQVMMAKRGFESALISSLVETEDE